MNFEYPPAQTQEDQVLRFFRVHPVLDSELAARLGITRTLPSVIYTLRKKGYKFKTVRARRGKRRWASYVWLDGARVSDSERFA